jgi:hypothetical protein
LVSRFCPDKTNNNAWPIKASPPIYKISWAMLRNKSTEAFWELKKCQWGLWLGHKNAQISDFPSNLKILG